MTKALTSFFASNDLLDQSQRNQSVLQIYIDFEKSKKFFTERIRIADDVVEMLS